MRLTSSAFEHGHAIDSEYTCEGADISPPLAWSSVPSGTQSLALIVDDPDAPDPAAPKRVWVHWVLFDIPPETGSLPKDATEDQLPPGTRVGVNDWGRAEYGGPCPPIGKHRYVHTLYALDVPKLELSRPTKAQLLAAMEGHVLARAELIGTYQKHKHERKR